MENTLDEKIKIGISACMYGAKVRYNSKGFNILGYLKREKNDFLWTPICPEVMSGLSVPRPTIRLIGGNGFDFWEGRAQIKNKLGKNVSGMLKAGTLSCFETLKRVDVDAYIFMEGSPSCGIYRTTLKNKSLGKPPGILGALLLKEQMFLIPALDLQSPLKWWDWKRRLVAFTWFKRKNLNTLCEILECWDILKTLCQEIDEESSENINNNLESFSDETDPEKIKKIQIEILNVLRKPSDSKKIKKWLWENYNSLKKMHNIEVSQVRHPEYLRGVTHVAEEILQVELEARKEKKCFKSSPIDYAPGR